MRIKLSSVSTLAVVALCLGLGRPAGAQLAAVSNDAAPVVSRAALDINAPRPVAQYRFRVPHQFGLPWTVTVADSAGELVASFRLPNERESRPMLLVVIDTALVLQGETPSGVLTIQLYGQTAPGSSTFAGRWKLGPDEGRLRGRVLSGSQIALAERARPVVASATTPSVPTRIVAQYHFAEPYRRGMPTLVTVSDSAGSLVARFRVAGDRASRPMVVSSDGSDLVLQGQSPVGMLTLQLFAQNEPGNETSVGRWQLAGYAGTLRARNARTP
jgi:hypothetical protein